ncbi:NAD(P)-dependent alcohol dehydrogenase [Sporobolomyces salmoneus]|uniref:NAD(P)-dependent alcohol dehydrogenase n=1 Tax=Sporobolomyces salmoneus TaxID=183962 RepID=UPI003176A68A
MSTRTMKAWVYRTRGQASEVLNLESDYPRPTPSGDQVLIKVRAVAINPLGWKMMGVPPFSWMGKIPSVPEFDVSGTIVEGGLTGTDLKEGEAVFGVQTAEAVMKTGQGVLAEYALVPKQHLRRLPKNLDFEKAAVAPVAVLTAIKILETGGITNGGAAAGKRVFINGGSSAVGINAVLIASAYGAQVSTTCSSSSRSFVESLASDIRTFDYRASPLPQQLADFVKEDKKPFDVIFDCVGVPALYHNSPSYLSSDGQYIDIAGRDLDGKIVSVLKAAFYLFRNLLQPTWLGGTPRNYKFVPMSPSLILKSSSLGTLEPVVDNVFDFEDAKKAYERSMSGRARGRIVIRVAQD